MIGQIDAQYIKKRIWKLYSRFLSYLFFEGRPLTTRGQWINGLVFLLFKLWNALPQLKKVIKPIFIIGIGRSGTTALGITLSLHKDIGFLNEPKALWHAAYRNEDVIGSYSMGEAQYSLDEITPTPRTKSSLNKFYGAFLFCSLSTRIVDKYPELIYRTEFVDKCFPDAKYLFLVRNGFDTLQSIDLWSKSFGVARGFETHDWWGRNDRKWEIYVNQIAAAHPSFANHKDKLLATDDHIDRAALEWTLNMQKGLELVNRKNNVFLVKYEDLSSKTELTINSIVEFCELEKDQVFLNYAIEKFSVRAPKGKIKLNPLIEKEFIKTMKRLGYHND